LVNFRVIALRKEAILKFWATHVGNFDKQTMGLLLTFQGNFSDIISLSQKCYV